MRAGTFLTLSQASLLPLTMVLNLNTPASRHALNIFIAEPDFQTKRYDSRSVHLARCCGRRTGGRTL